MKRKQYYQSVTSQTKASGTSISIQAIAKDGARFEDENAKLLAEARAESQRLRMKKNFAYAVKKGLV